MHFKNWPLKLKISVLFVSLTSMLLSLFALIALNDFKKDKITYAYETVRDLSKSKSTQLFTELEFHKRQLQLMLMQKMARSGVTDSRLYPYKFVWIYSWDKVSRRYKHFRTLSRDGGEASDSVTQKITELRADVQAKGLALRSLENSSEWLFGLKYKLGEGRRPLVIVSLVENGKFLESFVGNYSSNDFLLNYNNEILITQEPKAFELANHDVAAMLKIAGISNQGFSRVFSVSLGGDSKEWLASISPVGGTDIKVLSMVPRDEILRVVDLLWLKSGLMLVLLVAITVFVSVLGSHGLTLSLRKLLAGIRRVSKGDLDTVVEVNSKDEVGELTDGFNQMTGEIKRLLSETAEKTRMEEELKTAQLVQSTLFPKEEYDGDGYQVRGYYRPASECSGDWWHYNEVGDKVYLWIGDATGHGVPAALVTSATKSASSILENYGEVSPSEVMKQLNHAVYETARGQVHMTFFVGCFDKKTLEFKYVNASHDSPYVICRKDLADRDFKVSDLGSFDVLSGYRLGQDPSSEYEEGSVQLQPGDQIFFYTDGITELMNKDGRMWTERKMVREMVKGVNRKIGVEGVMEAISEGAESFRDGTPLEDDITYFIFQVADDKTTKASA